MIEKNQLHTVQSSVVHGTDYQAPAVLRGPLCLLRIVLAAGNLSNNESIRLLCISGRRRDLLSSKKQLQAVHSPNGLVGDYRAPTMPRISIRDYASPGKLKRAINEPRIDIKTIVLRNRLDRTRPDGALGRVGADIAARTG